VKVRDSTDQVANAAASMARRPPRSWDALGISKVDVSTGIGPVVKALLCCFDDIITIDATQTCSSLRRPHCTRRYPSGTTLILAEVTAEDFIPPAGW
jgi:hypothetical protein